MLQDKTSRIYAFDNIKFILIFLVVFGHLLEIAQGWGEEKEQVYRLIYSFHMPVFMFFSGWFARFKREKIVFHFIYMYFLFQVLYQAFYHFVLQERDLSKIEYQFTTPYWILWYLLAIILFYLMIPLLDVKETWKQILVVLVCFVVSLLAGNDSSVGYYFTLGRFFSFLPYFIAGYYIKNWQDKILGCRNWALPIILSALAIVVVFLVMQMTEFPKEAFYGSYSYEKLKIELSVKLIIEMIASFWIVYFLFALVPFLNFKIPLVSTIGRNSLSVFLLHGFVIKLMEKEQMGVEMAPYTTVIWGLIIVILLGNRFTNQLFTWVGTGWWLEKVYRRLGEKF